MLTCDGAPAMIESCSRPDEYVDARFLFVSRPRRRDDGERRLHETSTRRLKLCQSTPLMCANAGSLLF